MKRILFALAAACLCGVAANARPPLPAGGPDDTVSFRVSPQTAAYVAANVGDVEVQTAIAVSVGDVRDSAALIKVVITERQVIAILQSITGMPEGVAAEPNKLLLYTLYPYLSTRPWLAENAGAILDRNAIILKAMTDEGFRRIGSINSSVRRN